MTTNPPIENPPRLRLWQLIAPGLLVAATGVGAGDLMTASIVGSEAGVVVLWAVVLGAVFKWTVNEGLARWQMATDTTLLEGWVAKFGLWVEIVFLAYLLVWSLVVGGALASACGVALVGLWSAAGLAELHDADSVQSFKASSGAAHALVGLLLVWLGGFRLFERLMGTFIAMMFATVMITAVLVAPDWSAAAAGLVVPRLPAQGIGHVVAIVGGVGGTVTVLCYGYWIREDGRRGASGLARCRFDLAVAYSLTALFGAAMVLIGSQIEVSGQGAMVALELADQLARATGQFGELARWLFLIGFWGAVFSSLLGVWQGVPYLAADFFAIRRRRYRQNASEPSLDLVGTWPYRVYLVGLATVPLILLWTPVRSLQIVNAILGATFMPLLALTLLVMNNRRSWVGGPFTSGWFINALLVLTLTFFAYAGITELTEYFAPPKPVR